MIKHSEEYQDTNYGAEQVRTEIHSFEILGSHSHICQVWSLLRCDTVPGVSSSWCFEGSMAQAVKELVDK